VIECGAGMALPTVRRFCERMANARRAKLIRINVRESTVPSNHIGLAMGAMDGIQAIQDRLPTP
jgi:hypothetical protein